MELLEGIAIGVAGSITFALLAWLTRTSVLPTARAFLYRGPNISGNWNTFDSRESQEAVGHASITQRGNRIIMTNVRVRSRSGRTINREFTYRGTLYSGQLSLLFEDVNSPGYVTGAMVLRLTSGGSEFVGKTMYFDDDTHVVVSHDFVMRRPT